MRAMPVLMLRAAVRLYQAALRPVLGPNCRFTPSCSDYALDALAAHGALRGSALAARRVLRCNPWCQGGHDPVPPARPDRACAAHAVPEMPQSCLRCPTVPEMIVNLQILAAPDGH